MKPLISIIVPVYNASRSIERCIRSILSQTYTELELILIDDGSTDDSLSICQNMLQKDSRITIMHQTNQGVGAARNSGLAVSKGDWIAFVDSDDYLGELYLDDLLRHSADCDLIIGGYNRILLSENKKCIGIQFPNMSLPNNDNDTLGIWDKVLLYGTPWGKLFNSSLIKKNNIAFPLDFSLHEDHIFFYDFLLHTHKIRLSEKNGYNYVNTGKETLSRKHFIQPELKWNAFLQLSDKSENIIDRFNLKKSILPKTQNFIIRLYISAIINCYRSKTYNASYLIPNSELRNRIRLYHQPVSIQGYAIKYVLSFIPARLQRLILKFLII